MAEEDNKKQEPEKPQKNTEHKTMNVPLPLILGIGGGAIVLIIVAEVFGYFIASRLFPSQGVVTQSQATVEKSKEEQKNTDIHKTIFLETNRITTNPKDGAATFIVVNLGLEFIKQNEESKELEGLTDPAGKVKTEEVIVQKLLAHVKTNVNTYIASYTLQELQMQRPELEESLKNNLQPIFKEFGLKLVKVGLIEFIIQE
jgi:hypothetical protein